MAQDLGLLYYCSSNLLNIYNPSRFCILTRALWRNVVHRFGLVHNNRLHCRHCNPIPHDLHWQLRSNYFILQIDCYQLRRGNYILVRLDFPSSQSSDWEHTANEIRRHFENSSRSSHQVNHCGSEHGQNKKSLFEWAVFYFFACLLHPFDSLFVVLRAVEFEANFEGIWVSSWWKRVGLGATVLV